VGRFWWLLPGPAEFIRGVADELREGRNLVLLLPRHLPDGLADAVRAERFPGGDGDSWRRLAPTPEGPSPARQIAERFLQSVPSGPVDASWLASQEHFAGKVVWLEELAEEIWLPWRDFLAAYAHASRSRSLLDRTVFVAELIGLVPSAAPVEDVALAVRRWSGAVELLDQLLYVTQLMRDRRMPPLQRDIYGGVISRLALWDPEVSEALIDLPLQQVLQPNEALAALAKRRGWTTLSQDPDICWREGIVDHVGGGAQVHSAVLAAAGDSRGADEVSRRIWSAQVGVLLPYVEGRRRELLERVDGQLIGPFRFSDGLVVQDPRDLEIGQIEYQLTLRGRKVPPVVSILKQIRNRLAHLEVVGVELLQDAELTRPL
jgi:hypothetical protein